MKVNIRYNITMTMEEATTLIDLLDYAPDHELNTDERALKDKMIDRFIKLGG